MRRFILYFVLFLTCVCVVSGQISCHQCASKDGGCLDKYGDDDSDGCGLKDTHCLKLKTISQLHDSGSILGKPRETVVVTRGCTRRDGFSDQCRLIQSASAKQIWCICSSDNCNAGTMLVSNAIFLLGTALLARKVW